MEYSVSVTIFNKDGSIFSDSENYVYDNYADAFKQYKHLINSNRIMEHIEFYLVRAYNNEYVILESTTLYKII